MTIVTKHRIIIIVAAAIIIAAGIFAAVHNRKQPCNGIVVNYYNATQDTLIDPQKIIEMVYRTDSIEGKPLRDIHRDQIRGALEQKPYIENADLSFGLSGKLRIAITQAKVIARIINTAQQHHYLTATGILAATSGIRVRVPVFTGYISPLKSNSEEKDMLYDKMLYLALALDQVPFMQALTEQVYIRRDKQFEIIPKVGYDHIVVGDTSNLITKFNNLQCFYQQKLPYMERSTYKYLDISFDNQIIAKR